MELMYTDEKSVPINVNIKLRELQLLQKLTEVAANDDWRYHDLNKDLEEIIKTTIRSLSVHFEYAQSRQERQEQED